MRLQTGQMKFQMDDLSPQNSLGCVSQSFMASSIAEGEPLVIDSRPNRPTAHWEGGERSSVRHRKEAEALGWRTVDQVIQ